MHDQLMNSVIKSGLRKGLFCLLRRIFACNLFNCVALPCETIKIQIYLLVSKSV